MVVPIPYLIAVAGGAIIRATARTLPKLLARFKNSKQIKNPSKAQVDDAKRLTENYTNFSKSQQKFLKKNDTANPTVTQSLTGTGRNPNQIASNKLGGVRKTGEGKRINVQGIAKGVLIGGVTVGGAVAGVYEKLSASNKKEVKKAVEAARKQGKQEGQIETLLKRVINEQKKQVINEQKKQEAAKNKPMPRPKNLISGAVKSARRPPSRPSSIK